MKKIKNNKGFALAEILAVTLVLMVIFTVLYSNFMPLSGEYARSENYNDISSQYELHYFRKLFQEYITDEALQQQANNEISTNKYILLIGHDTNGNEKSCDSLAGTNKDICTNLKAELNPTLILTNYNISSLKNELKKDTNKLPDLRTYILSLPDYNDRDNQQEIYRLIIKTNSGYATTKLYYTVDENSKPEEITSTPALEFAKANVGTDGLEELTHEIDDTLQIDSRFKTEYRYRGGNVANYVTFNNETWRIIGIMPTEDTNGNASYRFKLVRNSSIGQQYWNKTQDATTNSYNNWLTSDLNEYINTTYYNTLTTSSKTMIEAVKYYLGGHRPADGYVKVTSDEMWQSERKNEANRDDYYYGTNPIMQSDVNKKIALMYASDFGYAASKLCTKTIYDYHSDSLCNSSNNWLDNNTDEWLINPFPSYKSASFRTYTSQTYGKVEVGVVDIQSINARPVIYLSSNVKISGGEGTTSSPYQLTL